MKQRIDSNAFLYPMPMVLAGSIVNGKPNFLAVGWVSRVNYRPPMIAISLGPHWTNQGFTPTRLSASTSPTFPWLKKRTIAVSFPARKSTNHPFSISLRIPAGRPSDRRMPRRDGLPACGNRAIAGEHAIYRRDCGGLVRGGVHNRRNAGHQKDQPFTLTMPDNHYWGVGDPVGRAWRIGAALKKTNLEHRQQ